MEHPNFGRSQTPEQFWAISDRVSDNPNGSKKDQRSDPKGQKIPNPERRGMPIAKLFLLSQEDFRVESVDGVESEFAKFVRP